MSNPHKSIDSYYEHVIAKLTSDGKILKVSKSLVAQKTNDKRVLYVFDILKNLNNYPKINEVKKSQSVSTHYRNLGNKCFQKSSNYEAWQYYNLSLLHAPHNTESYVLAISNRSAVFFSLQKYKECLKDIEKIFSMNYPKTIHAKLVKRQSLCIQYIKEQSVNKCDDLDAEIDNIFEMKMSRDEKYLCASKKLQVIYNEQMGRHVVAKEDIKAGEIIVQEDPYFSLLLNDQILFYCSYCLSTDFNLSPCHSCCFALYCSKKCRKNAWKEYHEVECPLMATLKKLKFTKLEILALRTVIKARNDHQDWESMFKTIDEAESANIDNKGCVKVDDKWVYDSKYYASIHTLASNIEKRSISDIFQKCVTSAVFLYMLMEATDFLKADSIEMKVRIRDRVAGMILHHSMTSPTNMHGLSSNLQTKDGYFTDEVSIASAPFAFLSLLNHSCAPNVVRFTKLGTAKTSLFALRPIKKGMQVFDNYGHHHAIHSRETRRSNLEFQYKFACVCEACTEDWPMYFHLKPAKNLSASVSEKKMKLLKSETIKDLQTGAKGTALKLFRPLCDLLQELEPYAPCVELADCQEAFKQCLAILEGLVPYGYSELVKWPAIPKS